LSILEAILLGILQGLTEFIPVSSTAHLTVAGRALGLIDDARPEAWTAFLAVVQLGTLVAVVVYFWSDLVAITRGVLEGGWARARGREVDASMRAGERLGWLVALGTVPIVIVGLLMRDVIEGPLTKDLVVIGCSLIGLALVLYLAERVGKRSRALERIGLRDALFVGIAQVASLVPGASRSGTTLAGGLFSGLDREAAARYSFLLSIPAIGGAALFELPAALAADEGVLVLLVGVATAAVAGYLSIEFLLRYLRRNATHVFVGYRLLLGAGILAFVASGRFF
jgi:undecaprenyl-diphosphatase